MYSDARKLDNGSEIRGDLCIVGAGTAGICMAMEWNRSPKKVILLEGGGLEYNDQIQDLYNGTSTGQRYFPLRSSRLHYFGGTSNHWSGYCSTLDPIDFQARPWVPHSGWPISKTDLDPFYARAQGILDLGPFEYEDNYWQEQDPQRISLPFDQQVVWNKIWQFSPPTRMGKKYRDQIFKSPNILLFTHANAINIILEEDLRKVAHIEVTNLEGKTHRIKANRFVLACGAIQNARLLLASNQQLPSGVGNQYDLVGRYFMEHLEIKSAELWLSRPYKMGLYELNYGITRARAELALTAAVQEQYRILNGTASLSHLVEARNARPIIDLWNNEDPRKSREQMMNEFRDAGKGIESAAGDAPINRAFQLFTRIEQAPNPESRIKLVEEKDQLGMPRVNLHWILTSLEKRSIRKLYTLIGQQAGISGLGRVRLMDFLQDENDMSWPASTGGGWHHMGTTRMSEDPSTGVVDANCKVHGLDNLFVAGSSCFSTAGAANPTLSLIALTIRLSDHLKKF